MRTSRKTDFWKLKITLVTMTYHSQRPQCPSLSPHVLLFCNSCNDYAFLITLMHRRITLGVKIANILKKDLKRLEK